MIRQIVERGVVRPDDFIPACPICGARGGKDIATNLLFYRCGHWVGYYHEAFEAEDLREDLQNGSSLVLEIRHEGEHGFPVFSEWYFNEAQEDEAR